jgi:ATP-binding cassette, subfamily B, bacterial
MNSPASALGTLPAASAEGHAAGTGHVSSHGGLYANLWRYAKGAKTRFVLAALLLIGSQSIKLVIPWLAAQAINDLQQSGAAAVGNAAAYVGLVMLSLVGAWALHGPGRVLERAVGIHIRQAYADALYGKLMRLPMAWHDRNHSSEVQQRVSQSTGALYSFAQNQVVYLQSAVNLVGPLVALCLFSSSLGAIAFVGYLIVGVVILRFDATLMRLAVVENSAERKYHAALTDSLSNVSTVLSLRLQDCTRRLLGARISAIFVPLRTSIKFTELKWCTVDLFSVGLTWGLVATFVWISGGSSGTILIGSIFMVYQYATQASGVVGSIAGTFQGFAHTRTDFDSSSPIWSATDRPDPGCPISNDWTRIDVRDLCYEHESVPRAVSPDRASTNEEDLRPLTGLHHVAISLERGDRIALVGPSGSGKSTLLRVLAGLHAPTQRQIEVDSVPQIGARHLGSISTLIPQEADVFEATVRENVAFNGGASDEAVLAVIRASVFDAVIADMPQGLDTPISERGLNLSGGQRQRLCLARGLLAAQNSSLIMLDEPTSALDPMTEEEVLKRISIFFARSCLVASIHRMSLLRHFNKVVLMADGRILDTGRIEDLLKRQSSFRQMMAGHAKPAPVLELAAESKRRASRRAA